MNPSNGFQQSSQRNRQVPPIALEDPHVEPPTTALAGRTNTALDADGALARFLGSLGLVGQLLLSSVALPTPLRGKLSQRSRVQLAEILRFFLAAAGQRSVESVS